jgi:hypothetical protein
MKGVANPLDWHIKHADLVEDLTGVRLQPYLAMVDRSEYHGSTWR